VIDPTKHVHFVGIGGVGMSALAEALLARGTRVSGSDLHASPTTERLAARGARIFLGHDPQHVTEADVVVVSAAIPHSNVELVAARTRGVPVHHRAEVLAQLLAEGNGIAVVGTHGKTTTAAMTAHVLAAGGYDPTALIGAEFAPFEGNVRIGHGRYVVAEVDESDGSLLYIRPAAAVVTSLDITDHRDYYRTRTRLMETFAAFVAAVPVSGFVVVCTDHANVRSLRPHVGAKIITYALGESADYTAHIERLAGSMTHWTLLDRGQAVAEVTLRVPGRYNVANALAATAVARELGMPVERIGAALATFQGLSRRFSVRGDVEGIMVVDDYAHNPTKVAAVLRAAKECWPDRRVVAIFQPHRFTRTKTMFRRFAAAFRDADELIVTEIYPADEPVIPGVSAALIVDAVRAHQAVTYLPTAEDVLTYIVPRLRPHDLVLTLGAGDIWQLADALVAVLRAPSGPARRVGSHPATTIGDPSG